MSRASLERAIPAGRTILLDSSVVIAYLDGGEPASPAAIHIIDRLVRPGRNPAIIGAVTVTEVLVRPFAAGEASLAIVEPFLTQWPNLRAVAVSYAVAREAARIRALTRLPTPDALILATAVVAGADVVVANDARWQTAITTAAPDLTLCQLDAHLPV